MVGMATIRNRGEYQWEVQIRRKGYPAQRKTFETKADAQAWARMIESEMDRGVFVSRAEAERTLFSDLIDPDTWQVETSIERCGGIRAARLSHSLHSKV
jgi:hypothetical protein